MKPTAPQVGSAVKMMPTAEPTAPDARLALSQHPSIIMQQAIEETAERLKHQAKTEASRLIDEAVTGELSGGGGTDSSLSQVFRVAIATGALVGVGVLKTQLTARLFHIGHQPPTAYSLYSCIVVCCMLVPIFVVRPSYWAVPKREMARHLSLIVFFTALDLGFTNIALSELSTALQQCIASTNPFWTILIE
jgi:hypothetical protein